MPIYQMFTKFFLFRMGQKEGKTKGMQVQITKVVASV